MHPMDKTTLNSHAGDNDMKSQQTLSQLRKMDPYEFEELVADVWTGHGWETTVTTASNDKGIDVIATKENPTLQKQAIQAKRYKKSNTVGSPDVQQYSSIKHENKDIDSVVIVTTSSFSAQAEETANNLNVKTIDSSDFLSMVEDSNMNLQKYAAFNTNKNLSSNTNLGGSARGVRNKLSSEKEYKKYNKFRSVMSKTIGRSKLPAGEDKGDEVPPISRSDTTKFRSVKRVRSQGNKKLHKENTIDPLNFGHCPNCVGNRYNIFSDNISKSQPLYDYVHNIYKYKIIYGKYIRKRTLSKKLIVCEECHSIWLPGGLISNHKEI